jgi:ubiquinone/menaquinone biosynthesis C-methylase UbiE
MKDELVPADYTSMDLLKAQEFDRKVKQNFSAAFPAVVRQIIETCGVRQGICVDVGSGTALLSIELVRMTRLTVHALEKAPAMFRQGIENITGAGLSERIEPVPGDAHQMPFADEFADLVVSRGSYHFWDDKPRVFKEIYRVLKPGGAAFTGGGFGHGHSPAELERMVKLRDRSLADDTKYYYSPEKMIESIDLAGISGYRIIYDDAGLWTYFTK